jgi:hypothetical protein
MLFTNNYFFDRRLVFHIVELLQAIPESGTINYPD